MPSHYKVANENCDCRELFSLSFCGLHTSPTHPVFAGCAFEHYFKFSFFPALILFYWRSCLVCCASQELCLSLYTNKICVKSLLALEIYKLAAFIILQQFWGKEQSLFAVGNVLTTISYSFWQATTSISLHFQKKVRRSLLGTQTWNLNEQW